MKMKKIIILFALVLIYQVHAQCVNGKCNTNTLGWDQTPNWAGQTLIWYIGETASTTLAWDGVTTVESPNCCTTVEWGFRTQDAAGNNAPTAYFTVDPATNEVIVDLSTATIANDYNGVYQLFHWGFVNNGGIVSTTEVQYSVMVNSRCYDWTDDTYSVIDLSSATLNDVTVTVLGDSNVQTIVYENSVAQAQNDPAFCGNVKTILVSDAQSWLIIDENANKITIHSTDANDTPGTFDVTIQQVLVDFINFSSQENIQPTKTFQVTIQPCEVTSVDVDLVNSIPIYQAGGVTVPTQKVLNPADFPKFTITPACPYTTDTMYAKVDGTLITTYFYKTVKNTGTAPDNLSITPYTDDRAEKGNTYTIEYFVSLDDSCVGTCKDQSLGQYTITWQDYCELTTINLPSSIGSDLPAQSTRMELQSALTGTVNSWFTNTVADSVKSDSSYCGDYSVSISSACSSVISIDTTNKPTSFAVSFQSSSNDDAPNFLQWTQCILSASLVDFSSVTAVTKTFEVHVTECYPTLSWDYSATSFGDAQTYIIGGNDLIVPLPTYTMTPACGTPIHFTTSINSGAGQLSTSVPTLTYQFISTTDTAPYEYTIKTSDNSLIGTHQITSVTASEPHYSQSWSLGSSWTVTITSPCQSTTFIDPSFSDLSVGQLNTQTKELVIQDQASIDGGNNDGFSLCGARTATIVSFHDSAMNIISQPTSLSFNANVLTFSPTLAEAVGTAYYVKFSNCLDDIAGICSSDYLIKVVVDYCKVMSYSWSGTSISISGHYTFITGDVTQDLPTLTPSPDCGYTQSYSIANSDGSAAPSMASVDQANLQFTINSQDISEIKTHSLIVQLKYTDYPGHYTPNYATTAITTPFTVEVLNPCGKASNTIDFNSVNWSDMAVSVLRANGAQIQYFQSPKDLYSLNYDSTIDAAGTNWNWYQITSSSQGDSTNVASSYAAAAVGSYFCGARTYTVSGGGGASPLCSDILTITETVVGKPRLEFYATDNTKIGSLSCQVKVALKDFPAIQATKSITLDVQYCIITNIYTNDSVDSVQQYILADSAYTHNFPTYIQEPLCGYTLAYSCQSYQTDATTVYPDGNDYTIADPNSADVANLQAIESCTTNYQVYLDTATLDGKQYQGDYKVVLSASSKIDPNSATTFTNSDYFFVMRLVNPCKWSNFDAQSYNTITQSTLTTLHARVHYHQFIQFTAFKDSASSTYGNQVTKDGITLCGSRSYQLDPTTEATTLAFLTLTKVDENTIKVETSSTLNSEIGYTGHTQPCWTVDILATLDNYADVPEGRGTLTVCIEECMVLSFAPDTYTNTASYQIWHDKDTPANQYYDLPAYIMTPACEGYTLSYSATIEKLDTPTNLNTDLSKLGIVEALTDTSHWSSQTTYGSNVDNSFIKFYGGGSGDTVNHPNGYFYMYSNRLQDNGGYKVDVVVEIIGQKTSSSVWTNPGDYDISTVSPNNDFTATITYVDPCDSATLNDPDPADILFKRVPEDVTTSVQGDTFTQNIYEFIDSVSFKYDTSQRTVASSLTGVAICGPRVYSFSVSSDCSSWLCFDQSSDGKITITSTQDSDVNFDPIMVNGVERYGHKVRITAKLRDYPTQSTFIDFYVKITECKVLSFVWEGVTQPDFEFELYKGEKTQPIVSYKQTPACGYDVTIKFGQTIMTQVATGLQVLQDLPSWLVFDFDGWQYKASSNSNVDTGDFTILQLAQIKYSVAAEEVIQQAVTASTYDAITLTTTYTYHIDFNIKVIDPCVLTTITPQNGVYTDANGIEQKEIFYADYNTNNIPIISTYVKRGEENTPSGESVVKTFNIHNDDVSEQWPVQGRLFTCYDRKYSLKWTNQLGAVVTQDMVNDKIDLSWIKIAKAGEDSMTISVYTDSETYRSWINKNWGNQQNHLLELTVSLADYPTIQHVELFQIEIQSCIVKQIKKGSLGSSAQKKLDSYTDLTPFEFELYYVPEQSVQINSFTVVPLCDTNILTVLEIMNDSKPPSYLNDYLIQAQQPSTLQTVIKFASDQPLLDQAVYGDDDPTQPVDNTQKNPFHLTVKAYLEKGTYNLNSLKYLVDSLDQNSDYTESDYNAYEAENKDVEFWVWARNPCRHVKIDVDDNINDNQTLTYFISDRANYMDIEISKTSMLLDSNYGFKDVCGKISYSVVGLGDDSPQSVSQIFGQDFPMVVTYTDDFSLYGTHMMRVKSNLPNPFDFIAGYGAWTVTAVKIESLQEIPFQYYKIGDKELKLAFDMFYLEPKLEDYQFVYQLAVQRVTTTGVITPIIEKDWSEWITFDDELLELSIQTTQNKLEANYTISLLAYVHSAFNIRLRETDVYGNNSFIVQLSKDAPPIENAIMPEFRSPIIDQTIMIFKTSSFKLPEAFSSAGYKVDVTSSTSAYDWLEYNEESRQYKIDGELLTDDDIGGHQITVVLTDETGTKSTVSFMIFIEDDLSRYSVAEDKSSLAPVPTIQISEKGLMTIEWDKRLKIPRNLTETRLSTVQYYDVLEEDIFYKEGLEIIVEPGKDQPIEDVNFTWNYVEWQNKKIDIQLYFTDPLKVAYEENEEDRARVRVIFWNKYLFVSKQTGAQVLNYTSAYVGSYNITLKPQLPIIDAVVETGGLDVVGDIGQVILQLVISYFLNNLWSVIAAQQIVVLLPLFNGIHMDPVTTEFFAFLMEIAAFDIVPTDVPFTFFFGTEPPDPLNEQFDNVGFGTTLFWFNLGSLTFAIISFPFTLSLARIFKRSGSRNMIKKGVIWERSLFWNNQILILNGSYVILCICTSVNIISLEWISYGYYLNNISAITFFCICCIFPFFQLWFCLKYYEKLEEPDIKKKYSAFYDGNNLKTNGFVAYNFWFLFRRLLLAQVLVFVKDILFVHLSTLVFQIIVAIIIMGSSKPMEFNQANKMEYFNEIMILFIMYAVMCLTDWQYDETIREYAGQMMIIFVLTHVSVNLILMVYNNIDDWRNQWRRYRLLRKHAKGRGIRNRKIQKRKRHKNWVQTTKKIEKEQPRIQPIKARSHMDEYSLRAISNDISEVVSSAGLSDPENIDHKAQLNRQPADGPEKKPSLPNTIELGADHGNKQVSNLNQKLGIGVTIELPPGFEKNIHNSLKRSMDEDAILGDQKKMFDQAFPNDWGKNGLGLFRMGNTEQGFKRNREQTQKINNKISRMAIQDVGLSRAKVIPDLGKTEGHKVQADTRAIHSKLFSLNEAGDGQKSSSNEIYQLKKRQTITSSQTWGINSKVNETQGQNTQSTFKNRKKPKKNGFMQGGDISVPNGKDVDLNATHKSLLHDQTTRNNSIVGLPDLTAETIKQGDIFVPKVKDFNPNGSKTDIKSIEQQMKATKKGDIFVPQVRDSLNNSIEESKTNVFDSLPSFRAPNPKNSKPPEIDSFRDFDFGDDNPNQQI